ncbi:methyltransferase, FkbM family [Succinivibrio dextrinosolvens]|uniref:FkbM family methyltransferase n=1 Tax=Succinivibrio dextrinosolvens TaxID=83771 RepID=UPI0008EFD63C|nr:FkbM family methyltransferase [Succinivibrio dextrinosolvens]SFS92467.1 methyltransferase, FkbM family [Succinivibrio dextrinosolvens]
MRIVSFSIPGKIRTIKIFGINCIRYCDKNVCCKIKDIKSSNPTNLFLIDLLNYFNEYPQKILIMYQNFLDVIDKNIYQKLTKEDRILFLRWIVKRFEQIDTIFPDELKNIEDCFNKAKIIFSNRHDKNESMDFYIGNKRIKFISNIDINLKKETKEQRLINYYEPVHAFMMTEYIHEGFLPKNGQSILDCGAARGDTAILFKTFFPDSFVYSFECDKSNIEQFKKNIKLNKLKDVFVQEGFLYYRSGEAYLADNRITDSSNENSLKITTIALDDYVKKNNIDNIGLIKFDIEGAEQDALKGAILTIKTQRPILAIPIYHLSSDVYKIPIFLSKLDLSMTFSIKWTEKLVWGVDCVLFVRFSV